MNTNLAALSLPVRTSSSRNTESVDANRLGCAVADLGHVIIGDGRRSDAIFGARAERASAQASAAGKVRRVMGMEWTWKDLRRSEYKSASALCPCAPAAKRRVLQECAYFVSSASKAAEAAFATFLREAGEPRAERTIQRPPIRRGALLERSRELDRV